MTQQERIMDYMERFGSISPMEAFSDLGITKLATRISELIQAGEPIVKHNETGRNRFGEKTHYTRYSIRKDEK